MSRGLSKRQALILGLLTGTEHVRSFACGGALTTAQLVEALIEREMLSATISRKQQIWTVRRACISLLNRGLVEGTYTRVDPYVWARTISWKATK